MKRLRLRIILPFWLLYLVLTANFELSNLVVGLLIAVIANYLMRPEVPDVDWRRLPSALLALAQYLLVLMKEIIISGVQVARIVLTPSLPIRPGIIAIESGSESELATALSAHAITITPGEMVVEIDENNVMYTHVLDVTRSEQHVEDAQRLRRGLLQRIFV